MTSVTSWRALRAFCNYLLLYNPMRPQCRRWKCHWHCQSCEPVSVSPLCLSTFDDLFPRFSVYKDSDLMDFINAPVGKGLPITKTLSPLIAIPTTAGTGSETTGTAILDITSRSFKTGIANRALKPVLGIVVFISPQNSFTTKNWDVWPSIGHAQHRVMSNSRANKRRPWCSVP